MSVSADVGLALTCLFFKLQGFNLTDFDDHVFKPKRASDHNPLEKFFKTAVMSGVAKVKMWDGFKELGEKMERNMDKYFEQMTAAYSPSDRNQYNLLNHGDFHTKNLMYRNEGETQDDVFLVSLTPKTG